MTYVHHFEDVPGGVRYRNLETGETRTEATTSGASAVAHRMRVEQATRTGRPVAVREVKPAAVVIPAERLDAARVARTFGAGK